MESPGQKTKEKSNSLEDLLFDLSSKTRDTRLSAIYQLQYFISEPSVLEAFHKQLLEEDDHECLFFLTQGIKTASDKNIQVPSKSDVPENPTSENFVQKFLSVTSDEQFRLIRSLSRIKDIDFGKCIHVILQSSTRLEIVQAVLSAPEKAYASPTAQGILEALIKNRNSILALRALQILSKISPGKCVPYLPKLLLHSSIPIRAMAIQVLFELCPSEAMRLLAEFLFSDKIAARGIGISMLFNFPFEEISSLLLELIEKRLIPESSMYLVTALVTSNPNTVFMENLIFLVSRRPGEIPFAESLIEAAAESLSVSGLETGSPAEVLERYFSGAQKKLRTLYATNLEDSMIVSPSIELPKETDPALTELQAVSEEKPLNEDVLKRFSDLSQFNDSTLSEFILAFQTAREEALILGFISIIAKKKIRDRRVINHLVGVLEGSANKILISAISTLEALSPRILLPHLPILCCHSSAMVATFSLKSLKNIEGNLFPKRISEWLKDTDPHRKKTAMIALTLMDFSKAKNLILETMQKSKDYRFIEALGNIFLMNPEKATYWDLRNLAQQSESPKKEILLKLAEGCKENVKSISGDEIPTTGWKSSAQEFFKEIQLAEKADAILEQIRQIHYRVQEGSFFNEIPWQYIILVVMAVFVLLLFNRSSLPEKIPSENIKRKAPIKTKIQIPKSSTILTEGAEVFGTLQKYDPYNQHWKFKAIDGSVFKIILPEPGSKFKENEYLSIFVSPRGKTPLGFFLYQVLKFKKIASPPKVSK